MEVYDHNNKEERVNQGRKVIFMIGWTWFFFFIGSWIAVKLFWRAPVPFGQSPAGIAGSMAFYGIIPAIIMGIRRAGKDMRGETDEKPETTQTTQQAAPAAPVVKAMPKRIAGFKGLTLGLSCAYLADRGHGGGLDRGTPVHLSPADVCKNIWIAGGIGGGKTTRFINPLLQQVLQQDCSALIFDIKGDFRREVDYIAGRVGRRYEVVGDGGKTLNLFRGCTPEVAASYLKSCFIAGGSASGDGAFWAQTATNYCRNLLILINLSKGDYSIAGLADLVFSADRRMEAMTAAREREMSGEMDSREVRVWRAVLTYMVDTVDKWEDKFRGNVQGTCEAVLNPFISPDLVDAFSIESEHGEADLYDLLNKETIYLVNLPRHKFGNQGARFAYLLIKLRFFTMMAERRARPDVNQDRHVCFLCDEYQGIVDSVSDTDFWDKSRSSKCFGIVSMQGYSSLVQAVGSEKTADAIMQNWRQRAIFRTEDGATLSMVQRLLGQVDVHIETSSYNQGTSRSDNNSVSRSQGEGQNFSIQRQGLFEANDFRMLDSQFALFIGNVGDQACDDVIQVEPLFVPEDHPITA